MGRSPDTPRRRNGRQASSAPFVRKVGTREDSDAKRSYTKQRAMRVLSSEQVAAMLETNIKTVRCWLRRGRLPGVKAPGGWRILEADLIAFLGGTFSDKRPRGHAQQLGRVEKATELI